MAPTHFRGMTFTNATFNPYIKFVSPAIGKDLIIDDDGTLFSKMAIGNINKGFITFFFKHLEHPSC